MQFKWAIWIAFCNSVTGATISRNKGHENENTTKNAINSNSDDYDTSYPDYIDRDYPILDYYDDSRGGRSFNHNHDNPSNEDGNFDEQDAEEFMIQQLRSTIPGTPGLDYALYQSVPETSFRCESQNSPGFYGDVEAQCQVFHICQEDDRQDSFLCPVGTVFNQISLICDWWFNFNCKDTPTFYHLNNKDDSSISSTFMKDTMRRMKKLHNNEMHKMVSMAKINMKIYNMKKMMENPGSSKLHKPSIKNLFMQRLRNKKFDNIRKVMTNKREAENFVTALPVIRTPLALQAMSSTGYFDIELSENATSANLVDFHEQSIPYITDYGIENNNTSDIPSTTILTVLETPSKSLNTSRIEMTNINNGSAVTDLKSDHIKTMHNETSATESLSMITNTHNTLITKNITLIEMKTRNTDIEDNKFEAEFDSYTQAEYPSKLEIEVLPNKTAVSDHSQSNQSVHFEKQSRPTLLSLSKPFSHENRFILGNDTHISVSVTIHAKSGNSKLQWKRLPGLKRIRKTRFKDENATSTQAKNAANDSTYRKKNNVQKSRSIIMWIPAKRNILDRKLDWKHLFGSKTADTEDTSKNERRHMQALNEFEKATLESTEIPQIIIKGVVYDILDPELRLMNKSMITELSDDSNTFQPAKYMESNISLTTTEENFQQFNETKDFPSSNLKRFSKTERNLKSNLNMDSEIEDNCKTICIKLLKNLEKTSMREFENNTDIENISTSMLLTNESSYIQNQNEYQHKGVLDFSPSEQWILKYDPGPNCSENTDNDKILIKGWSVIIDVGSITKEKTIKRRSCTSSSNDKKIVLKNFNFVRNSHSENKASDSKMPHFVMNSNSRFGSADQRYWINLVRNWLTQPQSSKNQKINNMEKDNDQNMYSNYKHMFDENIDSKNSKYQDQIRIRSENLHKKILPRYQTNFDQKFDLNSEPDNGRFHIEDSNESTLLPEYSRRRQQKIQDSTKPAEFSDLQSKRSDWSQDTQRTERLDFILDKRDSNNYNSQDVISEGTSRNDKLDENIRKRSTNIESTERNQNYWISEYQNPSRKPKMHNQWTDRTNKNADQDYDDWSSQERLAQRNWMPSRQNGEPASSYPPKLEEWKWPEKKQKSKKKPLAKPDRNMQHEEPNNDWFNDKQKTSNTNKGFKPDFGDRTKDWSTGNRNKQDFDRDNQPSVWQQDFDQKFPEERHKARSPNSMSDRKGEEMQDVWSMIKEELKDYFMKKNQKDRWSVMKPPNSWSVDINETKKNSWTSDSEQNKTSFPQPSTKNKHSPNLKNNKAFWPENPENNWQTDQESKWIMKNQMGGKKGSNPADKGAGGTMVRGDGWYTEENTWNWEEQVVNKPLNKAWNQESTPSVRKGTSDTNINFDNVPGWSSMPKVHQNKGHATKVKIPQNPPSWADDDEDDIWSPKSPKGDSWPSDHTLNHMNVKGNIDSKKPRTPSTPGNSWNSNDQNKWKDDEEAWSLDFPVNRPHQKQDKGTSSNRRMKYPQWKSDVIDSGEWLKANEKQAAPRIPNNSKGSDFTQGTADWENNPWNDHITLTKDIKVADKKSHQLHGDSNSQQTQKADRVFWSMDGQSDSTVNGYGRASHNLNMNNYWRSLKDIKGSRTPEYTSPNSNDQNTSANPRKNFARNESDIDIKSITWSAQISNDGKLANGWIPITLSPNLKNRENGSQANRSNKKTLLKNSDWNNDKDDYSNQRSADDKSNRDKIWDDEEYLSDQGIRNFAKGENQRNRSKEQNNKGSSSMEVRNKNRNDWNSEDDFASDESQNLKDIKMTSWNSDVTRNSQNTPIAKYSEVSEIDPVALRTPEASLNYLIYIPPKSTRNRRSYKSNYRRKEIREAVNRSYIIIKNGKILKETPKSNNKTFISKADITVRDDNDKTSDENFKIQKISFLNITRPKQNSSIFQLNQARILKRSDVIYETSTMHDAVSKESVIREVWSSPLISTNLSASGWIPVTTFKDLTNKKISYLVKNDKMINIDHFQDKKNTSLSTTTSTPFINQVTVGGTSKHLHAIATDSSTKNQKIRENKNGTNTAKSEGVIEMEVGNETLRILSFSDVMKHFQNRDKASEDYKRDDKLWKKPITINTTTYSQKLNDQLKEMESNFSNSWIYSSNENMKKPWLLTRSDDNLDTNATDNKNYQNPDNRNIDANNIRASKIDQFSNSTLDFSVNKNHSSNIPEFKFTSWNANSNWIPVIRTIGRVISYNRTLLSR